MRAQRRERNWARRRRARRASSGSTRTCAACSARCTGRQSSIGAASAARQSRPRKRRWGCRARCARPLSSQRRATARLMLLAQTMNQQRPRKKKRSRRPWDGTRRGRRTHTAQRGTCGCRVQRGKIGPAAAQIEGERNMRRGGPTAGLHVGRRPRGLGWPRLRQLGCWVARTAGSANSRLRRQPAAALRCANVTTSIFSRASSLVATPCTLPNVFFRIRLCAGCDDEPAL